MNALKRFLSHIDTRECTLFLDRDGVINEPMPDDYVKRPEELILSKGAIEALSQLRGQFKYIFIITNQQGIGREIMTIDDLENVHLKLWKSLKNSDMQYFDAVFYAPYLRSENHRFRKPQRGMIDKALEYYPDIDLNHSIFVGDSPGDMALADSIGSLKVKISNTQFDFDNQDVEFKSLEEFTSNLTQN